MFQEFSRCFNNNLLSKCFFFFSVQSTVWLSKVTVKTLGHGKAIPGWLPPFWWVPDTSQVALKNPNEAEETQQKILVNTERMKLKNKSWQNPGKKKGLLAESR